MLHLTVIVRNLVDDLMRRMAQRDEHGATAVEYALMVGVIVIAIIASVSLFTRRVGNMFNTYSSTIPS